MAALELTSQLGQVRRASVHGVRRSSSPGWPRWDQQRARCARRRGTSRGVANALLLLLALLLFPVVLRRMLLASCSCRGACHAPPLRAGPVGISSGPDVPGAEARAAASLMLCCSCSRCCCSRWCCGACCWPLAHAAAPVMLALSELPRGACGEGIGRNGQPRPAAAGTSGRLPPCTARRSRLRVVDRSGGFVCIYSCIAVRSPSDFTRSTATCTATIDDLRERGRLRVGPMQVVHRYSAIIINL